MEDQRSCRPVVPVGGPSLEVVVVIQENEALRNLLASYLEGRGHFVLVTGDPEDGIVVALEGNALVITELRLPLSSKGLSVPQQLRKRGFAGPVLILTSDTSPEVGVLAEAAGAAYRLKPVRPSDILRGVEEARRLLCTS